MKQGDYGKISGMPVQRSERCKQGLRDIRENYRKIRRMEEEDWGRRVLEKKIGRLGPEHRDVSKD